MKHKFRQCLLCDAVFEREDMDTHVKQNHLDDILPKYSRPLMIRDWPRGGL